MDDDPRPPRPRTRSRRPRTRPRTRPSLTAVVLIGVGAVFGAVATLTWEVEPGSRVVDGVVGQIDDTASAISLAEPADLADTGFGVVGVLWREAGDGDGWQRTVSDDGHPTCLTPDDVGRDVRLGLVTDPGGAGRPASEVVAWLECGPGGG